jgi:F-type H+-transporting ATPase subunit a
VSKLLSRKTLVPASVLIAALVIVSLLPIPRVVIPEISISAEHVFNLFGLPITNTLLATWLTMIILIVGSWAISRRMKMVPGRAQSLLEMVIEGFFGLVEDASGLQWARRFFPIVMTIFIFLLVSNWLGLTPLYGGWGVLEPVEANEQGQPVEWLNAAHTVGLWGSQAATAEGGTTEERYKLAPMFRSAATDLNTALALALVSVAMTQYFGFRALGVKYVGKFVALGGVFRAFTKRGLGCAGRIMALVMGGIDIFVGFVETISEIAKVISFSFRLFGNIFAGEVLLGVIAFLIPYLVSLPFFGLEILVGLVQALVFMMLTVAFFVVAISGHGGEEH